MRDVLLSYCQPSWRVLAEALKTRKTILFEGAQGLCWILTMTLSVCDLVKHSYRTGSDWHRHRPRHGKFCTRHYRQKPYATRVELQARFQQKILAMMATVWASVAANWNSDRPEAPLWLV